MRRWVTFVDQVLANASNALFTILVARMASPATFGQFTVGYAVLAFAVLGWRNGLGYQVSLRAGNEAAVHREMNRAVAVSLLVGPLIALVVLLVIQAGEAGSLELALGVAIATPFVLTQDLLRYAAVAAHRVRSALASDVVWTAALGVAVVLLVLDRLTLTLLVTLWTGGAIAATALLVIQLKVRPRRAGLGGWVRASWRGRTQLISGALTSGGAAPIAAGIVAATAGPQIAGGVAGAGTLMAPVNALMAWLSLTLLANTAAVDAKAKRVAFVKASIAAAAVTIPWGLVLLAFPDALGTMLLGETWFYTKQALPLVGLQYALSAMANVGILLLISFGRTRSVLTNGIISAVARIACWTFAGTMVGSVLSVTIADATTMAIMLIAVLVQLRRHHRTSRADEGTVSTPAS